MSLMRDLHSRRRSLSGWVDRWPRVKPVSVRNYMIDDMLTEPFLSFRPVVHERV